MKTGDKCTRIEIHLHYEVWHPELSERAKGETTIAKQTYEKVQRLIKDIGGTMTWHPGGPSGGGAWELTLHGKTAPPIEVRDDRINALDQLYVPQVDNPRTWRDYGSPGTLVDDAFWRLVDLFPR